MGDINGDGLIDLVSGSNCCDPRRVHVLLRRPDGSFAEKREVRFEMPHGDTQLAVFMRGRTRPHVIDWDGDGRAELVVRHLGSQKLHVVPAALSHDEPRAATLQSLPVPKHTHPNELVFADWDGDGRLDALATMQYRQNVSDRFQRGVFWFRNTATEGEPQFAAPIQLVEIEKPWETSGLAVVDWEQDGRLDLFVAVVKDWKRNKGSGWSNDAQLWLFRRSESAIETNRDGT